MQPIPSFVSRQLRFRVIVQVNASWTFQLKVAMKLFLFSVLSISNLAESCCYHCYQNFVVVIWVPIFSLLPFFSGSFGISSNISLTVKCSKEYRLLLCSQRTESYHSRSSSFLSVIWPPNSPLQIDILSLFQFNLFLIEKKRFDIENGRNGVDFQFNLESEYSRLCRVY